MTACVYDPPAGESRDDPDPLDPSTTTPTAACFAPGSKLCLEFEGDSGMSDGVAYDGSGNGFDATAEGVDSFLRLLSPAVPDDDAAGFKLGSRMTIDKPLELDGSITVEMWIQTTHANAKLFDSSNGRVYLSRNSQNQLECGINAGANDQRLDGVTRIDNLGRWYHVACVIDAESGSATVYVDGNVDDCKQLDDSIDLSRTGPTTLGAGSLGAIDRVHVFSRALTDDEICTSAGRGTGCATRCPTEGGGPSGNQGPGGS